MKAIQVERGQKFNRWTVEDPNPVIKKYGAAHAKGKGRPVRSFQCVCECGVRRIVRGDYLHQGRSKSCGCLKAEIARDKGKKQRTEYSYHTKLFWASKAGAQNRGLCFELTREQHLNLIKQDCTYCGKPPVFSTSKNSLRVGLRFAHNGIDRVDNSKGYTVTNSVPCCTLCNLIKRDLELDVFLTHVTAIAEHNAKRRHPKRTP
jgi:hypothetical protein